MNNTLKFVLCTICCTLSFNNGYSMDDNNLELTFEPQNGINNEQINQESDEEFLCRIQEEISKWRREIIKESFYIVKYIKNTLSSLSDGDQQRLKKLIEEKPDQVFKNHPLICFFLVEQKCIMEKSQYIKDLLYEKTNNKKCLLYFLKYKLLYEIADTNVSNKHRSGVSSQIIEIIDKELENM